MNSLNQSNRRHGSPQSPRIIDVLNRSLVEELNIYHQAYLHLERPLIQSSVNHSITKHELPITFLLQGDIDANIICLLDTYNKNISEEERSLFQSLYIESMNILMGKISTNLENKFYYSTILSHPITSEKETLNKVVEEETLNSIRLSAGYKMTYNTQEFDCRILFNIKKQKFLTEV